MTDASPRFLVVAPVGRDGELICTLLRSTGYAAECLTTIRSVERLDSSTLLGLILTDEALVQDGFEALRIVLEAQPVWSDLPILLLTSGSNIPQYAALASQVRLEFRNVFLLERPIRKELLLSAVQVAYNSRLRQLEIRDAVARQFQSDEALRNTEKLAMAGQLAATMAHEVNNPLEALTNLLFLVENSANVDEARNYGRLAVQELARISEIVNQTLRFHRAPGKPAITDVAELASSALSLFRGKLRNRKVTEVVKVLPAFAYCSAGEVRQALVNLIGNALDAMPEGGKLHLRVSAVQRQDFHYVRVTVGDTGSGIRREVRPNLFTQFFTTKGSRGTGLGLWLTRDIVLRNGGRLRYRTRTSQPSGTVFTMYLPSLPPFEMTRNASAPARRSAADSTATAHVA
ncbi:MAG: sensor histidine kinase [Acidobacteriota bacterium]